MIKGIGLDICEISRMERAAAQRGFLERVFSPEEIEYAGTGAQSPSHYAAAFAAREALAKAGGWGLAKMGLDSCFVRRGDSGPEFVFNDEMKNKLALAGVSRVFLSITHESGIAAAVVVLEGDL